MQLLRATGFPAGGIETNAPFTELPVRIEIVINRPFLFNKKNKMEGRMLNVKTML